MTETRRNRSSFTSTLAAICQRLDATPITLIRWKHPILGIDCSSRFTVASLWAVGSYARGAPNCGDLDLLAELVIEDRLPPPERMVATALFQGAKDVSLHIGTPLANTSEVEFPEARLLWQGQGCDWLGAIEAIKTDPSAGHYTRPMDRIPLQPRRLRGDIGDLEELLTLQDRQIIRWNFTPMAATVDIDHFSQDESALFQSAGSSYGQKTRLLLPQVIFLMRTISGWTKPCLRSIFNRTVITIGDTKVLLGRPTVPTDALDWLTTSRLLIVPHRTGRGPNGLWSIERGDQHALVLAVSKLRVYALFDDEGQPDFYRRAGKFDGDLVGSGSAWGIDLFTSLRSARAWNKQGTEDGEPNLVAKHLSPRELLSSRTFHKSRYISRYAEVELIPTKHHG